MKKFVLQIKLRNPKDVIIHSDYGTIYTLKEFMDLYKGNNRPIESF